MLPAATEAETVTEPVLQRAALLAVGEAGNALTVTVFETVVLHPAAVVPVNEYVVVVVGLTVFEAEVSPSGVHDHDAILEPLPA